LPGAIRAELRRLPLQLLVVKTAVQGFGRAAARRIVKQPAQQREQVDAVAPEHRIRHALTPLVVRRGLEQLDKTVACARPALRGGQLERRPQCDS
jgi:hypothetical protein